MRAPPSIVSDVSDPDRVAHFVDLGPHHRGSVDLLVTWA